MMIVPNWLTHGMAAAFFVFAALIPMPPGAVAANIGFAFVVLLVGLYAFRVMGWGGGIVKFYVASALWMGPGIPFINFYLASTLLASVYFLIVKGQLRDLFQSRGRDRLRDEMMPMAPFAYLTFLICIPSTESWTALVDGLEHTVKANSPAMTQEHRGHPLPSAIKIAK